MMARRSRIPPTNTSVSVAGARHAICRGECGDLIHFPGGEQGNDPALAAEFWRWRLAQGCRECGGSIEFVAIDGCRECAEWHGS